MHDPRYIRQQNARQEHLRTTAQNLIASDSRTKGEFPTFLRCGVPRDEGFRDSDKFKLSCSDSGSVHLLEHTCNSSFLCPCCSPRMMRKKMREISEVIDAAQNQGFSVYMVTHTIAHTPDSKLSDLMHAIKQAVSETYSCDAFDSYKARHGMLGWIRCYDVTYTRGIKGTRGWHPHFHNIMIFSEEVDEDELAEFMYPHYKRYIEKYSGRHITREAFNVSFVYEGDSVSHYVSKLNLAQYVTKQGKENPDVLYPFDLLNLYADGGNEYGELFIEYARATKGIAKVSKSQKLLQKLGIQHKEKTPNTQISVPLAILQLCQLDKSLLDAVIEDMELFKTDRIFRILRDAKKHAYTKRQKEDLAEFSEAVYDYIMERYLSEFSQKTADNYWSRSYDEYFDESEPGTYVDDLAVDFQDLTEPFPL